MWIHASLCLSEYYVTIYKKGRIVKIYELTVKISMCLFSTNLFDLQQFCMETFFFVKLRFVIGESALCI